MDEDWIGKMLDHADHQGQVTGWLDAMALVSDVVVELYRSGDDAAAQMIHDKVWRRLRAEKPKL